MLERFGASSRRQEATSRPWWRRHKAFTVLLVTGCVLLLVVGGWAYYLNSQLGNISQFDIDRDRPGRPVARGEGSTFLVVGVDNPDAAGIQEAVRDRQWVPGVYRSDTMMLVHVDSDGRDAQVVSIPRDTWVQIPGRGMAKVNAAFSYGGPGLLLRTLEDLLDHRIDHVAAIDIGGFADLTREFGGVEVRLTEPLEVPATGETLPPGRRELSGEAVVRYVRERKTLPRGDFDRVQRQQVVLRALVAQVLRPGTLVNPTKLTDLVQLTSQYVVTDSALTPGRIRALAWDSRRLRAGSMRFLTLPTQGTGTVDGQSIVRVDPGQLRRMFDLIERDYFESWLGDNRSQVDLLGEGGSAAPAPNGTGGR